MNGSTSSQEIVDMLVDESETNVISLNNLSLTNYCPWLDGYRLRHSALIERWKLCGFFQDDDFLDINCHWLQFEPEPLVNHLVLVCIFIIILLTGCFCNLVTVYILARHLRTPANIIVMNLAVSDFLMLIKMPIFLYNSLLQGPALGSQGCQVYGFMSGLTGTTSIMSLAAVAIDRYLVISHPLNINKKPTRTRAYLIIICIWIYSAIFASLPLFGIGKYVPEGYLTSCSFDYLSDDTNTRIFILSFFVAAWVVPFVIISSCYTAIVWYVRKARIELDRQHWNQQINASLARNCSSGWRQSSVEVMISKIVVGLVSLWMISWTPYAMVALLGISGNENRLTPGLTMLPALFAKLSACVNPIVYTLSHPKIRKEIFRRWYCLMSSSGTTGLGDVSVYGGAGISPGRQRPMWRQSSVSNSGSICPNGYVKRRSSTTNRTHPTVVVVHGIESILVRRQQVSLVTHDLRVIPALSNLPTSTEPTQNPPGPLGLMEMKDGKNQLETCLSRSITADEDDSVTQQPELECPIILNLSNQSIQNQHQSADQDDQDEDDLMDCVNIPFVDT